MIIQIIYSRLTRPRTIIERHRLGDGEFWVKEAISLDTTPAGAVEWIVENSKKIKGFVFREMHVSTPIEDLVPIRRAMPRTPSDNDVLPPSWAGTRRCDDYH